MMSPDYPWHNVPDYSLTFAIGFALILSVVIILATKYKSFRPYTAILIPVGSVEMYLLYYGGADSSVCVATFELAELLPKK
jgi:hypothetical protein